MSTTEEILRDFGDINCCQATLLGLLDEIDLDGDIALKIATGFGGGLGKSDVCGVVSGVCMAISVKHGMTDKLHKEAKDGTKAKVTDFIDKFVETHGAYTCRGLLGYDKSTEEGKKAVDELDLVHTMCPKFIKSGIELGKEFIK